VVAHFFSQRLPADSGSCRLDVADVRFEKRGAVVTLRRSKTDQGGTGREVAVPLLHTEALCPVYALRAWLRLQGSTRGRFFARLRCAVSCKPIGSTAATSRISCNALPAARDSRAISQHIADAPAS